LKYRLGVLEPFDRRFDADEIFQADGTDLPADKRKGFRGLQEVIEFADLLK
jgi:hypothetical protein